MAASYAQVRPKQPSSDPSTRHYGARLAPGRAAGSNSTLPPSAGAVRDNSEIFHPGGRGAATRRDDLAWRNNTNELFADRKYTVKLWFTPAMTIPSLSSTSTAICRICECVDRLTARTGEGRRFGGKRAYLPPGAP